MNAWSHLPNAHHIDWILKSVKENPQLWSAAFDVLHRRKDKTPDATTAAAKRYEAAAAAWNELGAATSTFSSRAMTSAAAWDAILILIAYDDCDQYINMGYEKLCVYATLSEKQQAVLLLPMVYVREKLNERMVTLT